MNVLLQYLLQRHIILCTACSVLPLLYSQPRVAVCVHKQLHVHELSDGGVIEDKDAFKEDYIDWGQRRYDRVIGVAICTSCAQYVYMGVSILLLYPSLFGPELPPYNLPQLFQRFRSLYPWPSRLWVAKRLTFTTFRILFTVHATSGMQLCSLLDCIRSEPVEPPLDWGDGLHGETSAWQG